MTNVRTEECMAVISGFTEGLQKLLVSVLTWCIQTDTLDHMSTKSFCFFMIFLNVNVTTLANIYHILLMLDQMVTNAAKREDVPELLFGN